MTGSLPVSVRENRHSLYDGEEKEKNDFETGYL